MYERGRSGECLTNTLTTLHSVAGPRNLGRLCGRYAFMELAMSRKSTMCMSKRTSEPLTEYDSKNEARAGADYANSTYGNNLVPYQCDKCNYWHLAPADRQTPSRKCHSCTDSYGRRKDLYETKEGAELRAEILYEEKGMRLTVYECPNNRGWHLTKHK